MQLIKAQVDAVNMKLTVPLARWWRGWPHYPVLVVADTNVKVKQCAWCAILHIGLLSTVAGINLLKCFAARQWS